MSRSLEAFRRLLGRWRGSDHRTEDRWESASADLRSSGELPSPESRPTTGGEKQENAICRAEDADRRSLWGGDESGDAPRPRLGHLVTSYLNARADEILSLLLEEMVSEVSRDVSRTVEQSREALTSEISSLRDGAVSTQREISRMGRELLRSGANMEAVQRAVAAMAPAVERLEAVLQAQLAQQEATARKLREEVERDALEDMLAALDGLEAGLDYGRELVRTLGDAQRRLKDGTVQRWWRAMGEATGIKRALPEVPAAEAEDWMAGLELTHRRLQDALARRGITPIEAVGWPFDPHLHEAVAVEPCPPEQDGLVLREHRRGYRTPEGILRLSQVVVGKAAPPKPPPRRRRPARPAEEPAAEVQSETAGQEHEAGEPWEAEE